MFVNRKHTEHPMTPAEFTAAGELLYGRWFKSPLARALGRDRNMIRKYSSGEQRIRPRLAAEIRAIVNIGPTGTVIRNTIRKIAPEIQPFMAHKIAKQIVIDLRSLGIIGADLAADDQAAPVDIVAKVSD
jgi:hypothetical protein